MIYINGLKISTGSIIKEYFVDFMLTIGFILFVVSFLIYMGLKIIYKKLNLKIVNPH